MIGSEASYSIGDKLKLAAFRICEKSPWLRYHLRLNFPARVGRSKILVPMIDGAWPEFEDYENWFLPVLEHILPRKSGAFFDIGANRGQTIVKLASLDPIRRYVGFEPNLQCCYFVEQVIQQNGLVNATILPLALSDDIGIALLRLSKRGTESSTIVEGVRSEYAYNTAKPIYRAVGDEIAQALGVDSLAVLKVDVEGGELEVLRGLRGMIARHRPCLIFEILPPRLVYHDESRRAGVERPDILAINTERCRQLFAFLADNGYVYHNVFGDGQLRDLGDRLFADDADMGMSNFIAVHKDEADALLSGLELNGTAPSSSEAAAAASASSTNPAPQAHA